MVTVMVASSLNALHHWWYLLGVSHTVTVMVASGLNANNARHLNRMLPLQYHTADCQQVPSLAFKPDATVQLPYSCQQVP